MRQACGLLGVVTWDSMGEQQDEASGQQWECNERFPGQQLQQKPSQHIRHHLHQSGEQAVQIRVSIHVGSAQRQAKVSDGGDEPENNNFR